MRGGSQIRICFILAAPLALAACNLYDLVDRPPTPTRTLEEIGTAVAETLVAEGEMTAAARPSDTPTPPEPSPTASDTPVTPTELPTEAPGCLVVASALNMRNGPGLPWDPPVKFLSAGTALRPIARNGDGSWLEVELPDGSTGWVSAGGQFISCNIDTSGLPLGDYPPPPTPTDTPTPKPTSIPAPTHTPTSTHTPTPTHTPSPTDTPPCPELTITSLTASVIPGSSKISVTWESSGGCGPFTGTLTATYKGDPSPYATYVIEGQRGTQTDNPEVRCQETIVYALTLSDTSGQTITPSISDIYFECVIE